MADRTISIKPIPQHITQSQIIQEFKEFHVIRADIHASTSTAYIQFANPSDVESLDVKFSEGRVDSLGKAEIGLVERDFMWGQVFGKKGNANFSVNKECLVVLKECENVEGIGQKQIREVFKQFGIGKIVKVSDRKQIILQFMSKEDLELLDMNFDDYKVPNFGLKARIDPESEVEVNEFVTLYNLHHTTENGKSQEKPHQAQQTQVKHVEDEQKKEKIEIIEQNDEEIRPVIADQKAQREAEEDKQKIQKIQLQIQQKKRLEEEERKIKELKEQQQMHQRQAQQKSKKQAEERKRKEIEQKLRTQKIEEERRAAERRREETLRRQAEQRQKINQQKQRKIAEDKLKIEIDQAKQIQLLNKQKLQKDMLEALQAEAKASKQLEKARQQLQREQEEEAKILMQEEKIRKQEEQNARVFNELKLIEMQQRELRQKKIKQEEEQKKHELQRKAADEQLMRLIEQERKQKLAKEAIPLVSHESSTNKKQIHLPFINTNINHEKEALAPQESTMTKESISQSQIRMEPEQQGPAINYSSKLPLHYITIVLAVWLYYIVMH